MTRESHQTNPETSTNLETQAASRLENWFMGENAYQFSRISPTAQQVRLREQLLTSSEGFGGDSAKYWSRYARYHNQKRPEDYYPQALQALAKTASCCRALYVAMRVESGMPFKRATINSYGVFNAQWPKTIREINPRELDFPDFFDSSGGLAITYLEQSIRDDGLLGTATDRQLELARGAFLYTAALAIDGVVETEKLTGELLLPKPGLSSGNIELDW